MVDLTDTICALSSAPGRSGIAVVRVSGSRCFGILERVFREERPGRNALPRQAVLGRVIHPGTGEKLDEALVTRFHAPHSYTGEDVAEISVHGSPIIISHLLRFLCEEGARLAEPGEFTMRAFLHGRMNLVQAEAVRDVIEAHTLYQLKVANRQQSGELARELEPLRSRWIQVIVHLETAVEFVEEDLAPAGREALAVELGGIREELGRWVGSFEHGRLVRDGFRLALVGRPNVGKSSLFNALLAEERSIVTESPGTTRDLVSESVTIAGIPVRLMDTAGWREGLDEAERQGIERSRRAVSDADAVLLVLDPSGAWCKEAGFEHAGLEQASGLVACNKSDLPANWTAAQKAAASGGWRCVEVSARTGAGIEELRRAIQEQFFGEAGSERDGVLITNLRHYRCLEEARGHLEAGAEALRAGLSEEFVLTNLHMGLRSLGEITGETRVESILGEIFSRFCVGK
jgi:tRNA modification GTPase